MIARFCWLVMVLLVVGLAGCGANSTSDSSGPDRVGETPTPTEAPTAPAAQAEDTVEAGPAPTPTSESVSNSTPDPGGDLLPLVGGSATLASGDQSATVELAGMVEIAASAMSNPNTRCLAVFGTITPERLGGQSVSSVLLSSDIYLLVGEDGRVRHNTFACDGSRLTENGYRSTDEARSTLGTAFPFFAAFSVSTDQAVNAVVLGEIDSNQAVFYSPDLTEVIPPFDRYGAAQGEPLITSPLRDSKVLSDMGTETWDVAPLGIVEVPKKQEYTGTGTCFAVYGTAIPTFIQHGLVTSPTSMPPFTLVADGRVASHGFRECDTGDLFDLGYRDRLVAEATIGTPYTFFSLFLVQEGQTPEALIVGPTYDPDNAVVLSAEVDESIVVVEPDVSARQRLTTQPLAEAYFESFDDPRGVNTFSVAGLVELEVEATVSWDADCYAIFGVITPPSGGGIGAPRHGVVADGIYSDAGPRSCVATDLEAAGYQSLGSLQGQRADGSSYAIYTSVLVKAGASLDAIILGAPDQDGAVAFEAEITGISTPNLDAPVRPLFSYEAQPTLVRAADLQTVRVPNQAAMFEFFNLLQDAGERNLQECMASAGFEYQPRAFQGTTGRLPVESDRELIERQGFGIATPFVLGEPLVAVDGAVYQNRVYREQLPLQERRRYDVTLGLRLPREPGTGCTGAALVDVDRFATVFDTLTVEVREVQEAFEADERLQGLQARWVACMGAAGYDYPDPDAAREELQSRLSAIVNAPGASSITDEETGEVEPATVDTAEDIRALADEELAIALAGFDCEQEVEPERRAVEAEYRDRFFAQYGPTIDQILADF